MRHAVALWDMAREGNIEGLSQHIHWEGREAVKYRSRPSPAPGESPKHLPQRTYILLASKHLHPERLERFRPGDVIEPAGYLVQQLVNEHLQGRVSPRLLWDAHDGRLRLYDVPHGLIGALWLQFARAIDGKRTYRRCRECPRWFELTPAIARTNKRFCSDACRFKAYRQRQDEARRLSAEGMALDEVAQRLGTDLKTVQGWVVRKTGVHVAKRRAERSAR
jgi:hypothetical protein